MKYIPSTVSIKVRYDTIWKYENIEMKGKMSRAKVPRSLQPRRD